MLFSSTSLHCSFKKAFFSLLAILWNSAYSWVYLSLSPLTFTSLLSSAIYKAVSDNHFAFLHFFLLGMVLVTASCTVLQSFIHSSSIQFSSVVQLCRTLWDPMDCSQASLSVTKSRSLLKLMSIESVMPSIHLILSHPILLLPSIFPSIRVFSNVSIPHIRWPKDWSFSFSISPSSEHSGLISFRMDWLDLLAVQGTLKSLLQHHSSKASILWHSAFFIVQLSHPYMTTGKIIL